MKYLIEKRLETLESEKRKGHDALARIDSQRTQLTETLLRIEGATTVLRELLAGESNGQGDVPGGDANGREPLRQVAP
jgi:hypothetical protein